MNIYIQNVSFTQENIVFISRSIENISSMFGGLRKIKFSQTQNFEELINNDLRRSSTRLDDYFLNESGTNQIEMSEKKDSDQREDVNYDLNNLFQIDSTNKGFYFFYF